MHHLPSTDTIKYLLRLRDLSHDFREDTGDLAPRWAEGWWPCRVGLWTSRCNGGWRVIEMLLYYLILVGKRNLSISKLTSLCVNFSLADRPCERIHEFKNTVAMAKVFWETNQPCGCSSNSNSWTVLLVTGVLLGFFTLPISSDILWS